MSTTAIHNIGELTTNDPANGGVMGRRHDAGVVLDEGLVAWVGDSRATPQADESIDACGRAVIPGFVDSHTHLVFAGDRAEEFERRMAGTPTGGGILRTVDATRAATTAELDALARRRRAEMLASGTTTVEVKSGYELTVHGERRMLEVARGLTDEVTWLGAHAVPTEFSSDRDGYVAVLTGEMLAACRPAARWADAFCDPVAFSVEECRAVLGAAAATGLGVRVHADQHADSGGAALAAELARRARTTAPSALATVPARSRTPVSWRPWCPVRSSARAPPTRTRASCAMPAWPSRSPRTAIPARRT